jgi:predicted O-methyltransferase YrrM
MWPTTFVVLLAWFLQQLVSAEYKYASSLSMEEIEQMVPGAFSPRPWPLDRFVTLAYQRIRTDTVLPSTVFIVYKGDDKARPMLTELQINYGDSVSELVQDVCSSGGWTGDDRSACLGVEVMDSTSFIMYGVGYTPKRANARIVDYIAKRSTVLSRLINMLQYTSYLEIGCDNGVSFQEITNSTSTQSLVTAVCVDPSEQAVATHHLTSDAYFDQLFHDLPMSTDHSSTLSTVALFDCVFIDGLHEANQAYRDFMNSWRALKPGGTILMHDVAPSHEWVASYPMHENAKNFNWHGDVWKVVVALRLLPDAEVVTIDIDCGVAAVRKRPNRHPLNNVWKQYFGPNPLSMLKWEHYRDHKEELMRFVSVDEFFSWINEDERTEIEVRA